MSLDRSSITTQYLSHSVIYSFGKDVPACYVLDLIKNSDEENLSLRDDVLRSMKYTRPNQQSTAKKQNHTSTGEEDFDEDVLPINDAACENSSESCQSA